MQGDFSMGQPKFDNNYVLVDWDGVLSQNKELIKPLFNLLKQLSFIPKVFSQRKKEDDNKDIFEFFNESEVLFSEGYQKKDMIHANGLKFKEISYWIESDFRSVVDKEDLDKVLSLINNSNNEESKEPLSDSTTDVKYVMIDWDETMSLNPDFTFRFFSLFKNNKFIPKIFTARKESDDNSDIFLWVDKEDVLFANRTQKKDALKNYNISIDDVAFWLDDTPSAIINKNDFYYLYSYYNS